jgi:exodeoxyribonuclease-5
MLTDEQQEIADKIIANLDKKHIQTLGGLAGTGKTVVVAHLYEELSRKRHCHVLAPTGKACDVLRRKGIPAKTIHKAIYKLRDVETKMRKVVDADGSEREVESTDKIHFIYLPQISTGVILVDEASMVSNEVRSDLEALGLPIVAVGDHGQLPPVKGKGGLMAQPDYVLETIHRNAGDIARFALHLRAGGAPLSFNGKGIEHIGKNWSESLTGVDQIICGMNKTRTRINHEVRDRLGMRGLICPGERLVSLTNGAGIRNGSQIHVIQCDKRTVAYKLGDKIQVREYNPDAFNCSHTPYIRHDDTRHPFDYAYCMTCHKVQGSEWNSVMVIDESAQFRWSGGDDMVRRWRYTAATRAKNKLLWASK